MAKEKVKIEYTEQDLKELLAEKLNLKIEGLQLRVSHWEGDQREPAYTSITVEGEKKSI